MGERGEGEGGREERGYEKRLIVFSILSKDAHKTDTQSSQKSRNNGGILPTVCAAVPRLLPSFAVTFCIYNKTGEGGAGNECYATFHLTLCQSSSSSSLLLCQIFVSNSWWQQEGGLAAADGRQGRLGLKGTIASDLFPEHSGAVEEGLE